MRVLVTGGTGVLGKPSVTALLRQGHTVRLFARGAEELAGVWSSGVEPVSGSIVDEAAVSKAVQGCDAVLHLAGIVSEQGDATFASVNVEGTRHVVRAAERAGVRRLVYVSSLGADRGASPYHRSKREAEEITRGFSRDWLVVRPGNVYGPGDEVISLLLEMVRTLPAVPAIDGGDHEFQPVWVGDVAEALARSVSVETPVKQSLDIAGPDRTSMNDLIARLSKLTDRSPVRVPVPGFLSVLGAKVAALLGFEAPLDSGQIQMLEEGNVLPAERNALVHVFGMTPTPLDEGLRKLADALPENALTEGFGSLVRRHVWADIAGSPFTSEQLFERFRARFADITPWHVEVGAEPGTPREPTVGATLTMHLPLRGNVQVRVEQLDARSLTLASLRGHPLAGVVRFSTEPVEHEGEPRIRFGIEVHDRAANMVDWMAMSTAGGPIQLATWRATVEKLVEESGGQAPEGVRQESEKLRGDRARTVEAWAQKLVQERERRENDSALDPATRTPDR